MFTHLGAGRSGMVVHRHVEILTSGPDRLVVRGAEGRQSGVRRHARQQNPAKETVFCRPGDLGDGVIDVVEEDLGHAGTPARSVSTEIGQPTIVRPKAGPAELVGIRRRRPCQQIAGWKKWRNRVREQDLRNHAIILELAETGGGIPIAIGRLPLQIGVWVHIRLRPDIELLEITTFEVVAVVVHFRAGVAVGRNHDVAVIGE